MTTPDRTVTARLRLDSREYEAGAARAKRATEDLAGAARQSGTKSRQAWDEVGHAATLAGAAVVAGVGSFVLAGGRFDKQMSAVSAATHATAGEMDRLRQAAVQAGEDTAFSATEAAQGVEELAKAGVSTSDILRGGLSGALDLAAAGSLSVGEAAETAASAMTQFRLSGKDVPHLADLLAAAAGKAQGSVHDMGQALNQAGLVASQMGLSVEETTGTLAAFASAGLLGSDAGTSFKTAMLMLANPTDKARDLMRDLGIEVYDAAGNFVGLAGLAGQLRDRLGDLTQEQRNAALATIFGSDAIRAASILYEQGADGIQKWIDKVNDQGFASETAATKTDNLMGDVEELTGSLESLAIESSTGASSGLRSLVQGADDVVESLSSIPAPVQNAVVLVGGLTGAALLAAGAAGKMRAASGRLAESLATLGPRGEKAGKGLQAVAGFAGKATIAIAALQVAGAAIGKDLDPQIKALATSMEEFGRTGRLSGEAARIFGDNIETLQGALKDALDTGLFSDWTRGISGTVEGFLNLGNVIPHSLTRSREQIDAMDQALTQLVAEGKTDAAAAAFDRLAAEGDKVGISVNELRRGLPSYTAALEESARAGDFAGKAQAQAAVAADLMGGSLEDAAKSAGSLQEALDRLHGATIDFARAEIDAEEAVDNLVETLKENGATLDVTTAKGQANKTALLDLVDAAKQAAQAKLDETGSLVEANKVYDRYIGQLRATLRAAGFTDRQIDDLIASFAAMPKLVSTTVQTPGLAAAEAAVRRYIRVIQGVPGVRDTRFRVSGTNVQFERHGGVHYAQAGLLRHASVFAARSSPLYAFAEPETLGEAFVPRRGDRGRSLAIGAEAMRWHGASVVPWEQMRAAQELLAHIRSGGGFFEDLSFSGMSANLRRFNDELADRYYATGGPFSRGAVERFLTGIVSQPFTRDMASWRRMFGTPWRAMGGAGGGGGAGSGPVVLEIRSGGSRFDDTLVEILRNAIRIRGGNVQIALGRD